MTGFGTALIVGMIMFALRWIGGGDAKDLAAACLWMGLTGLAPLLLWTAIVGGGFCLLLLLVRQYYPMVAPAAFRTGWLARQLGAGLASMVIVAAVGGLAAGTSLAIAGGEAGRIPESLGAIAVFLPAGAVFVTLTALAFSVLPRATIALGWGMLALGLVLGQFGDLIGLPEWLQDVSPFRHVPAVPMEAVEPWALVLPGLAAAAFAGAAFVLLRR